MTDANILTDTRYFEQESPQPAGDMVLTDEKYFDDSKPAEEKSAFRRGLESGVDQLQALGGGMAAVAGDALGSDKLKDWGMETYQANQWEASENALGYGFTDIDGVGKAFEWAGYTLGNLAPSLATTVMGGGVGGLAAKGLSKKMVSNMVKKEMAKGLTQDKAQEVAGKALAKRIAMANSLGVNLGAASTSAGMATGGIYGDTGDAGVAVTHGLASGVLDALPVTRMLKKLGGDKAAGEFKQSLLKEGAKQGVFEGGTEAAQSFIEQHARHWVATDGQSLLQSLDEVDAKELIDSMAAGALGGSVMGVGSQAVGNIGKPKKGELTEAGEPEAAQPEAAQEPMPSQPPVGFELTPGQARDFAQRDTQEQGADRGSLDPTVDYGKDFNPNLDTQPQSQFELTPEQAKEAAQPQASNDLVTFNDGSTATRAEVMEFVEDLKADGNEEGATQLLNFAQNANGDWALPEAEQGDNALPKPEENRHPTEPPKPEEKVTTQAEQVTDTPEMSATSGQVAPESLPTPPPATGGADLADGVPAQDIDAAANEAATSPLNDLPEPTEAQKEANNYKLGRIEVQGLKIGVENPKGSIRSGTDADGKKWESKIHHHYGDLTGTKGADGDAIDVFVGDFPDSEKVFVVDQIDQKTGKFDEHKVMAGFDHKVRAVAAYKKNYEKGWKVGPVTEMSLADFKAWLKGDTTKPLAKFSQEAKQVEPNKTQISVTDKDYLKAAQSRANALPESHDRRRDLADLEEIGEAVKTGKTIDEFIAAEVENDPSSEYEWLSLVKGYKFNSKGQPFKKEKQAQISRAFRETSEASVVPVTGGFAVAPAIEGTSNKPAYKSRKVDGEMLRDAAQSRPEEPGSQQPSINAGRATPSDKQTAKEKITPKKKSVKKGKKSLFDAKRLDTMLLGSYGRYTDLGREESSIDVVKDDAAKIIGFEIPFEVKVIEIEDKLVPMRFNLDERVIEVDAGISGINRGDAAMYMVEEVLHGLDVTGNGRTISASMKEFDFADGSVAKEAIHVFETEEKYRAFLAYPLDPIASGQLSEDRQKAELFARLGVLYLGDPDNFKQSFPNAYKSFDKIFGLESRPAEDSAYVFRRNWTNTAPNVQGGNKRAPNGAVQQNASGAVRQGRSGQGLGQIRSAIAKAFSGNALGKRANLKDLSSSAGYLNTRKTGGTTGLKMPHETKWPENLIRTFQDKYIRLKNQQKRIEERDGKLSENEDAYMAEELFHGKTEKDINDLEQQYIKPLVDGMAKRDIAREELDMYLIAKHAKERNAYIASINPEMPDGGSGMTNQEADDLLAKAKAEGKTKALDDLAEKVYAMTEARRELLDKSGLQDEAQTNAWRQQYSNYVPLKGFADNELSDDYPRSGKGFDIRGKESMKAMGRRTIAESPTLHVIQDLTQSAIRNRKNEVGQTFLRMVENHPDADLWEVFTDDNPDYHRTIVDTKEGPEVRETAIPMAMVKDDYLAVKRDGKVHYVKIKDKRLMEAMKNIGPEPMNKLTRFLGAITRWLSSVNTSLNPEFMVSNMARDIQTALYNAMAEQDLHNGKVKGRKIAAKMVKGVPSTIRAISRAEFGKKPKGEKAEQLHKYYQDFLEDGAKTGYFDSKDIDKLASDLSNMVEMAQGSAKGNLLKFQKKTFEFVEKVNGSVENGVRLSAYIEAREAGISRARAASFAKTLTVNFNRRGTVGSVINSLYMFANASIQGTANFARAIATFKETDGKSLPVIGTKRLNKAQMAAGAVMGANFALAMLNREMAGEDEDGVNWFDKIPNYVRERNFVLMKSIWGGKEGEYITIPMPYGYSIFANVGDTLEASVFSDYKPRKEKLAFDLFMSGVNSFSPLGAHGGDVGESLILTATPTVLLPFVENEMNVNHFGSEIRKENYPFGAQKSDSALSWRSTKDMYKNFAAWMNEVSGGNTYESGWFDVSPDTLEHLTEFALGGMYRLGTRTAETVDALSDGRELEVRNVPFLRSVSGKILPYEDMSRFYDSRTKLNSLKALMKHGDIEEKREARKEHGAKLALAGLMKSSDKQMRALRKRRDLIEANENLTDAEMDAQLREVERRMKVIVDRFNRRWDATE